MGVALLRDRGIPGPACRPLLSHSASTSVLFSPRPIRHDWVYSAAVSHARGPEPVVALRAFATSYEQLVEDPRRSALLVVALIASTGLNLKSDCGPDVNARC